MLIPWQVDVPQDRYPFMNWLIIAGIVAVFAFQMISVFERSERRQEITAQYANRPVEDLVRDFKVDENRLKQFQVAADKIVEENKNQLPPLMTPAEYRDSLIKQAIIRDYFVWGKVGPFILSGWSIKGLLGHMWLHGGFLHILGNLLFLWIFGNAVCAKIGNVRYLPIYICLGVIAGISHLIFAGGSVLGASGAINGIVGMFLVFFPQNEITCYIVWWIFLVPRVWEFSLSSYWMILLWFAFDLLGAFTGGGRVAHFAHLGGFFAGALLAIVMLKTKLVVMEPRYEKSLLDFYEEWRHPPQPEPDTSLSNFQRDIEFAKQLETPSPLEAALPLPVPVFGPVTGASSDEERLIVMDAPAPDEFIRFSCTCGKKVKIPAKFAGKSGRCPVCKKQIKIPG